MNLTKVTRDNLRDVEGSLWALWATAQQINARQKIEISIRWVLISTINMYCNYDEIDLLAKASRASLIFI